MGLPTFEGFSLQDSNFISERITFKGYASRDAIRSKVNRREGVKFLGTNFGEKEVKIEGIVVAASASALQTLLDSMKQTFTAVEGDLIIETDRTFRATVTSLGIPDEHYNQSKAPFDVTFVCSDPFAEASQVTATIAVLSGVFTVSGQFTLSGTFYGRPVITYTPPSSTGNTLIRRIDLYHVQTGQTIAVSGFNSGAVGGLLYQNPVIFNLDDFTILDGTTEMDNTGAFPKFEPGVNNFTVTASGRRFPGGTITITYNPRYL